MRRILCIAIAAALAVPPVQAQSPASRARQNYDLLMKGQKRLSDLSAAERAELATLEQLARQVPHDGRSATERCRADEIKRAGGSPSELEMRIIGLKCSQR